MNGNSFIHVEIMKKPKKNKRISPYLSIEEIRKKSDAVSQTAGPHLVYSANKINSSHHFDEVKRSISREFNRSQGPQGKIRFLRFSKKMKDLKSTISPRREHSGFMRKECRSLTPIYLNKLSTDTTFKQNSREFSKSKLPNIKFYNKAFQNYYEKLKFIIKH